MAALDPERLLLELAIQRGVLTPQTARDAYAAHKAQPSPGGLPETLVRRGVDAAVVGTLRSEVTRQLQASRVFTAKDVRTPTGSLPRPIHQPMPGDSVLPSRATPPPQQALPSTARQSSGVQQSLYAGPGPAPPVTPFNPDGKTLVARSVTEAMYPAAQLPTRRDAPTGGGPASTPGPSAPQQSIRPKVGATFGRYQLLAELGRGGMGVVFRAKQADLDRIVALKMLLMGEAAGPTERERFFSEARHAAKLQHRSIVSVHDVGEVDGIHYFTMDYIEGEDLGQKIRSKVRLEAREAVEVALQIADGLGYAHEQGVIHRDLKPSNVLIDKSNRVKITDFGIAKDLDRSSTTRAGEVLGTPNYMPPEQADGRAVEVDARADIYALGAVIYEMLTGRPPFEGKTGFAILSAVINERPTLPSRHVPSVPEDLEAIVLKCLEKDRNNRYPKVAALVADLERFRAGDSIEAIRPREAGGSSKVIFVAGVIIAALLGVGVVYLRDLRQRADAAQAELDRKAKEAEEANERARKADAERAAAEKGTALVKEALSAVAKDDRDHAIALAVEAVERAPKLALAHATLARLYLDLRSDGERAVAESDAALALDASSLEAHVTRGRGLVLQKRWTDALSEAEATAKLGAEGKAAAARLRGDVLLAKGELDAAIRELERAADLAARDAEARVALARAYLLAQRPEDAERAAGAAREVDPRLSAALLVRAEARARLSRTAEAIEDAREAARLAPHDPQARALVEKLGATTSEASPDHQALHKRADEALAGLPRDRARAEAFVATPRSSNECGQILGARGWILSRLGRYAEADELLTAAIEKEPKFVGHLGNRGLVREHLDRLPDALADFDAALAKGVPAGMVPAAMGRARVLGKLKRWDEAEKSWTLALESAKEVPLRAQIFHDRAKGLWAPRERWDEAEKDLAEAIALLPQHGHYWRDRGDMRLKKGDKDGALADYKAAIDGKQISPNETEHVREAIKKAESR